MSCDVLADISTVGVTVDTSGCCGVGQGLVMEVTDGTVTVTANTTVIVVCD